MLRVRSMGNIAEIRDKLGVVGGLRDHSLLEFLEGGERGGSVDRAEFERKHPSRSRLIGSCIC